MERSPRPIVQQDHLSKNPLPPPFTNAVILVMLLGIVLGILFRSINLSDKAYWVDEVHTVVRVAGHTKAEITTAKFDNQIHSVAEFNQYQYPLEQPPLSKVLRTLAQHPEHPPLYYLLARWWMQGGKILNAHFSSIAFPSISSPIGIMRSLSVLLGILVLPGVVALCQELFRTEAAAPWTTAIALSIFALSPLHCLYAQEAREYSLWTLATIVSCWSLLRAIRLRSTRSWVLYSLSLVVGWYSHLLFATVVMAQWLYVTLTHRKFWLQTGGAIALSLITFAPWIMVFILNLGQIQAVVDATQRDPSLQYLVNVWGRSLSRVLFNGDLGSVNLAIVVGVVAILVWLWRKTPGHVYGLITLLIGINAFALIVPDVLTEGISSSRIRYLMPAYIGLQLAIAHFFATQVFIPQTLANQTEQAKPFQWQRGWQVLLMGLLLSGAIAGCINVSQPNSWAKSDKAPYYAQMAAFINQSPHPLVITDESATYTLALSSHLRDNVSLLLVDFSQLQTPSSLAITHLLQEQPISDIFLFAPSPSLQAIVEADLGIETVERIERFKTVVRQSDRFRLLRVRGYAPNQHGEKWKETTPL